MRSLFLAYLLLTHFFCLRAEEKGNSIIVCENGLEMFHWDLAFLREAKESVEILACFLGGDTAQELLIVIENRLQENEGLQVFLLSSPVLIGSEEWNMIKRIQNSYPKNFHIEFTTQVIKLLPDLTSIDNHVKMFVVDEKYFSTGGTNLEQAHCSDGSFTPVKEEKRNPAIANFLPAGMRDQDIVGKGEIAKEFRLIFHQLFSLWENYNKTFILEKNPSSFSENNHYFPIKKQAEVRDFDFSPHQCKVASSQIKIVLGGPHQDENSVTKEYVRLIKNAQEEIIIEQLYFFPSNKIFKALLEAVNRGVKLILISNGLTEISPASTKLFCWANRINYVPMFYGATFHFWEEACVRTKPPKKTSIYEYHVQDVLLHKKMMLIDKQIFVLGSYNFGFKSAYGDYEMIVIIDSKTTAEEAFKIHLKDLTRSVKITPNQGCDWYFDPKIFFLGQLQKKYHGFL